MAIMVPSKGGLGWSVCISIGQGANCQGESAGA